MKSSITIMLAGDVLPANLPYTKGFGIASMFLEHMGTYWVKNVKRFFINSDIVFCNLESPLNSDKNCINSKAFSGHYKFAEFLKRLGVNIVSIANNHILEYDKKGFLSTIEALENQKIKYVGKSINGLSNIEIFLFNKKRLGFAGFNQVHDIRNPNLYANLTKRNVLNTIQKMIELRLDYKILSLHWGDEYINIPSRVQIELAHEFIDNGVDIIVGHHPHVIQPIEEYKNGLIFYSLGNCIFDMLFSNSIRIGILAKIIIPQENKLKYELYPIYLSENVPFIAFDKIKFYKALRKYNEKMSKIKNLSPKKYDRYYKSKRTINQIKHRFYMKLYLFVLFYKISYKHKQILLKNIIEWLRKRYIKRTY